MRLVYATWWVTCVLCLAIANGWAESPRRPNVLFLIADDLNCDLGCYGHSLVQSPNIDRLAKRGLRFERAYCQYPLCGPSRAAFMCSLYPDQTLIRANAIRIRERLPEVETMSQYFKRHGYSTARVGKIYHYNVPSDIGTPGHDDPASWDVTVNPRGRDKDDEDEIFSLKPKSFGGTLSWLAADGEDSEQTDAIGAAAANNLLEQYRDQKEPFFLAVGFYRPHTPYVTPKKYFELYPREKISVPQVPEGYLYTLPGPARNSLTNKKEQNNLPQNVAREAMQAYYAAITFMDQQVGSVLDCLERTGLADNTIVLMTSDHGYHMGEHGYYQKTTLFENATHVPLIIAAPGMKAAGKSTSTLAEMVDFYPTLAALAGLPAPQNLSGKSQAAVLNDATHSTRTSAFTQFGQGYSLRTVRYRYTEWGDAGENGIELYDHTTDEQEMHNLAKQEEQKEIITKLAAELHTRIEQASRVPEGLVRIEPGKEKK